MNTFTLQYSLLEMLTSLHVVFLNRNSLSEQVSQVLQGHWWCLDPYFDPLALCNIHPVMAHAALAPLLIPEPYCSLFVFSSFFPWAPGQWEEKVTVNIALKSSLPPIELLKMEQATSGWALPSCAGHFNCKTSNKYESLNVKDRCSEIICSVLTLQ